LRFCEADIPDGSAGPEECFSYGTGWIVQQYGVRDPRLVRRLHGCEDCQPPVLRVGAVSQNDCGPSVVEGQAFPAVTVPPSGVPLLICVRRVEILGSEATTATSRAHDELHAHAISGMGVKARQGMHPQPGLK
jgi:hypothetical protein